MSVTIRRFVVVAKSVAYLMARIVDSKTGIQLVPADFSAIHYSVWETGPCGDREVVEGHDDVELTISEVFFTVLQHGSPWDDDDDADGYNFLLDLWDANHSPWPNHDRSYQVVVTFERANDPPEVASFEARAI